MYKENLTFILFIYKHVVFFRVSSVSDTEPDIYWSTCSPEIGPQQSFEEKSQSSYK